MWPRFVSTPYFKYFLSFACLLLFFALSASPTMAVMTTSFEESEGYSHGEVLEGQLGWYKLGGLGGTTTVENIGGYTGWNTLYTTTTNYNYNGFYHEFATSK